MEEIKSKADSITDHVGDLLDTYRKLAVVNATQKASGIASTSIGIIGSCFIALFIIFFIGMGIGWWLGDVLNNRAAGFFIVGGIFLVLLLVLLLIRKSVIYPYMRNTIVKKVYE